MNKGVQFCLSSLQRCQLNYKVTESMSMGNCFSKIVPVSQLLSPHEMAFTFSQ